jgi:hypothetical protein
MTTAQLWTYMVAACVAIFFLFMQIHAAEARSLTTGDIYRAGSHWCNWAITATCKRWRDNGNRSYGLGCTGPNDMRSGCVAQRKGLR